MKPRGEAYERLTNLVGQHGPEWSIGQYELRYSEGESNAGIARSMGLPWFVLHRWLMENAPESIENAKAARTEWKLDEAERMIEEADTESIGLVKAQTDFALKLAGKRYRKEYGEAIVGAGNSRFGEGGIVINITGVSSPYLEDKSGNVIDMVMDKIPERVDNKIAERVEDLI